MRIRLVFKRGRTPVGRGSGVSRAPGDGGADLNGGATGFPSRRLNGNHNRPNVSKSPAILLLIPFLGGSERFDDQARNFGEKPPNYWSPRQTVRVHVRICWPHSPGTRMRDLPGFVAGGFEDRDWILALTLVLHCGAAQPWRYCAGAHAPRHPKQSPLPPTCLCELLKL